MPSNTPAVPYTYVRAYITIRPDGCSSYRSTVIEGDDDREAINAIRRVDMVEPPRPQNYTAFFVEHWKLGEKGGCAYWLDANMRRMACPEALRSTYEQRYLARKGRIAA